MAEKVKYPPFAVALAIVLAGLAVVFVGRGLLDVFLDWLGRNR
jgi:hypothetical protein